MKNDEIKQTQASGGSPLNDGLETVTTQAEADRITVFDFYGNAFIEFGMALKNKDTTISELSLLANRCNLSIRFSIDKLEV